MEVGDYLCVALYGVQTPTARCAYCSTDALYLLTTGANPDPEPVCGQHGASFLRSAAVAVDSIGAFMAPRRPA